MITIEELAQWRRTHDPIDAAASIAPRPRIERTATTRLPTEWGGTFTVHGYRDLRTGGAEHMALISPPLADRGGSARGAAAFGMPDRGTCSGRCAATAVRN